MLCNSLPDTETIPFLTLDNEWTNTQNRMQHHHILNIGDTSEVMAKNCVMKCMRRRWHHMGFKIASNGVYEIFIRNYTGWSGCSKAWQCYAIFPDISDHDSGRVVYVKNECYFSENCYVTFTDLRLSRHGITLPCLIFCVPPPPLLLPELRRLAGKKQAGQTGSLWYHKIKSFKICNMSVAVDSSTQTLAKWRV